jgi:hypothetical protein
MMSRLQNPVGFVPALAVSRPMAVKHAFLNGRFTKLKFCSFI